MARFCDHVARRFNAATPCGNRAKWRVSQGSTRQDACTLHLSAVIRSFGGVVTVAPQEVQK